ncbi:hypothetical protein WJX81_006954 [Elliptochloris bilobata]|uniref:Major facilitator superfamily (MFS) profile domain-containing protein n=1 Tax=Elliptochloris bilobata TaxID=381761 RepID=A0AAW1RP72_9CHLO
MVGEGSYYAQSFLPIIVTTTVTGGASGASVRVRSRAAAMAAFRDQSIIVVEGRMLHDEDVLIDKDIIKRAKMRTMFALNLAFLLEKTNEQVLPAAYKFIGYSLNVNPSQLGSITLARGLVQALTSPVAGLLGDRLNRCYVVSFGAILWGVMTVAIACSTNLAQAMSYSAVNGLGLALVIPASQSLVADYYEEKSRGGAFGLLFGFSSLGGLAGGFFATSIGGLHPLGLEGWRFAFHVVAGISVAAGLTVLAIARDPRRKATHMMDEGTGGFLRWLGKHAREMGRDIGLVLRIPTFNIVVLQGIVGTAPWIAMGWLTLYLQLVGFSDLAAAVLNALMALGCALGSYCGGLLGDALTKYYSPNRGKIIAAQLSVATAIPFTIALLKLMPMTATAESFSKYAAVLFFMGSCISWSGTNNSAMFSEIVPEQLRSAIYAFDRSFEGAVGATAAPLVGIIADRVFGYRGAVGHEADPALQAANANALGNSLMAVLGVPWFLCFCAYFLLYFTLPIDKRKSIMLGRQLAAQKSERAVELGDTQPRSIAPI